ncbi:hypothetical protein AX16_008203 [Volvariella volvacea WC 439]|nr:hypothetical protein AX16_008203 [Volvariella volvacea WC 439]
MVCGITSRSLGLYHAHSLAYSRLVAARGRHIVWRGVATATKQKTPTGASTSKPARPTAKANAQAAGGSVKSEATASKPQPTPRRTGTGMTYKVPEREQQEKVMSEEEQLAQVEQILSMSRLFPTADPWGQRVETLDVMIPYSVGPSSWKHYASWNDVRKQWMDNRYNAAKNATSLLMLAQSDAIPGVNTSEANWTERFFTQWPWRIWTTKSVKPSAWTAPLRQIALDTYKELNTAIAHEDSRVVKSLTTSTYHDHVLKLLKKSHNPALTKIWRFHKEVTPTRVISIRSTEGYLANEEPKFGNRMMVHALVKFDTEQSLEIYDKRGIALHTPANGEQVTPGQKIVPAERRRVTEYLVLEKRMWYDGPWMIREQLWEAPGMICAT